MRSSILITSIFMPFSFAALTVNFYSDPNCQTYVNSVHPSPDYTQIDAPTGILSAKWVDTTDPNADADGFDAWFAVVGVPGGTPGVDQTIYYSPSPAECISRASDQVLEVFAD
ncbi:hypothetical protein OIDMADRAFT_30381 [Oidiodendron maius Zn]|uniref:Uncharacterized protein n=1 Tax=Oidiodendron maius (strain Zn) TaxID=913774 RepID=A0A0C3CLW3_OIDMZ|nr:hypothetical protein OIDMADRAFT_30381 [Oidiodendron maius Zn]